jgi:hypothetical protein
MFVRSKVSSDSFLVFWSAIIITIVYIFLFLFFCGISADIYPVSGCGYAVSDGGNVFRLNITFSQTTQISVSGGGYCVSGGIYAAEGYLLNEGSGGSSEGQEYDNDDSSDWVSFKDIDCIDVVYLGETDKEKGLVLASFNAG